MANRMIHFEIQADDDERAKKFHEKTFGWNIERQQVRRDAGDGVETPLIRGFISLFPLPSMRILWYKATAGLLALAAAGVVGLSTLPASAEHDPLTPPSVSEVQSMIERKTNLNIDWAEPRGGRNGYLMTGTGTIGGDATPLFYSIECIITYPPLRIRCRIGFDL